MIRIGDPAERVFARFAVPSPGGPSWAAENAIV